MSSSDHRKKQIIYLLVILMFSYLFLFFNLGSYSLKEPDEGRYAEIPREMVERGDYVVPHLNYVRYFEKPPLLYWATALSYKIFGVSEWSFRFPNALAAFLCVLMTWLFVSRRFGPETGLLSALVLLTSFGFFALTHIVTIDMLFSFLLFGCLLSFHEYYREKRPPFLYLFCAGLALSVLAKGPVAVILLAATILFFLWSEKKLSFLKEMFSLKALLIFSVIAVPWFILICLREKEFFQFFFVDQHILRFVTTKHKRSGPVYYFIPVLLGGLFPWSIFIPRAVAGLWKEKELRLFFIWSLVVFVFFSLSGSKLPPYILPIFPAMSVVLAYLFRREWEQRVVPFPELIACAAFLLLASLTGIAHNSGVLDVHLARFSEIAAVSREVRWLTLSVSIVSVGGLCTLFFRTMRTYRLLFCTLAVFCLVVSMGVMLHTPVVDRLNTTKGLVQQIHRMGRPGPLVVNYGSFDETLPFYLERRTYIASYTGELEMGAKYADAKDYFLDKDGFESLFRSSRPVVLVMKEKRLESFKGAGIEDSTAPLCDAKRCFITNQTAMQMSRLSGKGR